MQQVRRRTTCVLFVLVLAAAIAVWGAETTAPAQPIARMDLRPIGFGALSPAKRVSDDAYFSLNFISRDRVLVTFSKSGLTKRLATCPKTHDDRYVHAAVLEIATGKVIVETDWYLHDRRKYIWPLGHGDFLLRKGNQLFRVDSMLREELVFDSPEDIEWASVTPELTRIVLASSDESAGANSIQSGTASDPQALKIQLLKSEDRSVDTNLHLNGSMPASVASTGFTDLIRSRLGNTWLVRFGPDAQRRAYITRVKSRSKPNVLFPTENTVLIGRCSLGRNAYSLSAFTVGGKFLWRQQLEIARRMPALAYSEEPSRFALSTIRRPRDFHGFTFDELSEEGEDREDSWQEDIDVIEIATGKRLLSLTANPPFCDGNYALSPDGTRLAVLEGQQIAIYGLNPVDTAERSRYAAINVSGPVLYVPPDVDDPESQLALADWVDEDQAVEAGAAAPLRAETSAAGTPAPSLPVRAAENAAEAVPAASFRSTTVVVGVDVVATNSKGKSILALAKDDFSVSDDGKPEQIRYFDEHRADERRPSSVPLVQRSPNSFSNISPRPEVSAVSVILYDTLNTPMVHQQNAQKQLIEFLRTKPPELRVALFTLTTNLRMIVGFTDEENALIRAIEGKDSKLRVSPLVRSDTGEAHRIDMLRQEIATLGIKVPPGQREILQGLLRAQAEEQRAQTDTRVRWTLDGFTQLARYLSGIPGRKNVIWMSASFPFSIGINRELPNAFQNVTSYREQIKKTMDLLAAAHVAVYPVDVRGTRTEPSFSAENNANPAARADYGTPDPVLPMAGPTGEPMADIANRGPAATTRFQMDARAASDAMLAERSTLEEVAGDTGGKAFYNTNDLQGAIRSAIEQGSNYYQLGYRPSDQNWNGKFRKIKVKLAKPGVTLSYRNGYFADDPNAPSRNDGDVSRDLKLASMQHGSPESRQIPFVARVVPVGNPKEPPANDAGAVAKGKKKSVETRRSKLQHYTVDYAASTGHLRFVPNAEGKYEGSFHFMITAFDAEGRQLAATGSTATASLRQENYQEALKTGFRMHQELDVPIDAVSLRMGIADTATSNIGTVEIPLPVPVPVEEAKKKHRALPKVEPD